MYCNIVIVKCNHCLRDRKGEWPLCVPSKQLKEAMLTHLFNYIYNYFPLACFAILRKKISY